MTKRRALLWKALVGSTRQITFRIPSGIQVTAPTAFNVTLRGQTSAGTTFASTNASRLTINPPAAIAALTPERRARRDSSRHDHRHLY